MPESDFTYTDEQSAFCLMPWIHFHMDTTGKVKACCSTSITYGQMGGKTDQRSIDKIWNGRSIRKFRQKLLAGESDSRCMVCYKREAAGKQSMRTETLEKYRLLIPDAANNTDEQGITTMKPVYLDLRFSNVCNLKCRTCWHGASSSWFEDARILGNTAGNRAIIYATTDNSSVLKNILKYVEEVEEIYFAGGEPLIMEEHYQLLDYLIESENTRLQIRYNTNLSLLNFKKREITSIWKSFQNVRLSVSIDALQEQGEYIRSGLKWDTFIANFRMIREKAPHIQMEIAPTVSVLNILELTKMHSYFVEENLLQVDEIYINLLDRPKHYNISILPESIKEQATEMILQHIEWINRKNGSTRVISEFNAVINFMNSSSSEEFLDLFHRSNSKLDDIRNEKILTFLPALDYETVKERKK
ncbi:MAG: twitch domain-containing radical SAM protein [Cyclobacteriaceae bacterium]